MFTFGTKAETLKNIAEFIDEAAVLPQLITTVGSWHEDPKTFLEEVEHNRWSDIPLIVRSSAIGEDSVEHSMAGAFTSIPNVCGQAQIEDAIRKVIESYKSVFNISAANFSHHQILVQPMLTDVVMSGVMFGVEPSSGSNHIVINYDDVTGSTESITSGHSTQAKTYFVYRSAKVELPPKIQKLVDLMTELENRFGHHKLDVEFAFDRKGELYLLQVRPLVNVPNQSSYSIISVLEKVEKKVDSLSGTHPYLYGKKGIFGIMPDWNPAEIIGVRPRPLALSLYRELITDSIWAYQRSNYGYKNLRSFPLLIDLAGCPYVDVRVSFNSFLPKDLNDELSSKLVNYYIERLIEYPNKHDKVEFDIIFSCYTLDLPERLSALKEYGFSSNDCNEIENQIRNLTNGIIHSQDGLWRKDVLKIELLKQRQESYERIFNDNISLLYWLIEDCKRYGTLPFAGLARAGFIAVQLLQSLQVKGVLNSESYQLFFSSLQTVGSMISKDFKSKQKESFLADYGHLRPGTYDILSPRYDETPHEYFTWENNEVLEEGNEVKFGLTLEQLRDTENLLKQHHLVPNALELFEFIKAAIEGREYSKFVFTKNLSWALKIIGEIGQEHGLSLDDCSYLDIQSLKSLYASSVDVKDQLYASVESGRKKHEMTKRMILPSLITSSRDIWAFERNASEPNFITDKCVKLEAVCLTDNKVDLSNKIVLIPSADPGYDWLFSKNIGGLITMYGGANSHMAIRAGELRVPSAIGVGEVLFEKNKGSKTLELDCCNKIIRKIN